MPNQLHRQSPGCVSRSALPHACAALLFLALQAASASARDSIVLYPAYVSDGAGVLEGRVLGYESVSELAPGDRRRTNLRRNLGFLFNDEREDVPVTARLAGLTWRATTDEEGYFRMALAGLDNLAPGWHRIRGELDPRAEQAAEQGDDDDSGARQPAIVSATTENGLLAIPAANVHGLISDVDDTVVVTEVTSVRRMFANTLLRNPLQREAVPGAAAAYRRLADRNAHPQAAPVFYLSASPRQLHFAIETFLAHNRFPPGVLITKRVTNDQTGEPLRDQMSYKKEKIGEILTRLPQVRFTLIGDDGERDPEIYRDIRAQFPDRVAAIWIRRVNPDPARPVLEGQRDMRELLGGE